ncbi:MAG: 4Fe-4S dicluster domain-containing protein [Deltaproteobacteria bacterium]|nr:MAG: 4Fe-4S dicluster domain-containing protein [Deltaproteobacteria bacterium]
MDHSVSTVIEADRCIGCGLCVKVCPSKTISMQGDKAVVIGDSSLSCGHCAAVCPVDAITIHAIDPEASRFATFDADSRWLPHGEFNTVQLVRLMASRRSCRNFQDKPVDRALLADLVKIGATAPSGTNSQMWTFTILPARDSVTALGDRVAMFFKRINDLSERYWLRNALRFIGKPELAHYYLDYHQSVSEALTERENSGEDRLFHGATAAIVVGSRPEGSTLKEDALLATQNILLAAHSMGLGTCLIGFAVIPMMKDIQVKRSLGIPDSEKVHAVIALGYPEERYLKVAGRKRYIQRYCEAEFQRRKIGWKD